MKKIILIITIFCFFTSCHSGEVDKSPVKHLKVYFDEGQFYLEHGKSAKAVDFYEKALMEAQADDNLYAVAVAYISLAHAHQTTGNEKLSVEYFNKANAVIPLITVEQPDIENYYINLLLGQYYETLANYDMQKGNKKNALKNLKIAKKYFSEALD